MSVYTILPRGPLLKNWIAASIISVIILIILIYKANLFRLTDYCESTLLTLQGNRAYNNDYWGDAGIFYLRALTISNDQATVRFNLANAYYKQGRYKEAISIYRGLLQDKKSSLKPVVLNNLGNAYYMQGFLFESFDAYKNSLLINDNDDMVRQNFLFVHAQILKLIRSKASDKKQKSNNPADDKEGNDKKSENKDGQKSTEDQSPGPYQVSDWQMNNLLKILKEQERVPKGSKSYVKRTNKVTDGPDY